MPKNKIKKFSYSDLFLSIVSFFKDKPFITSLIIFLFFLSSMSEAVGISALFVILLDFLNLEDSQNKITIFLNNFFKYFNITLSLNSMLFVFLITIFLKSVILFSSLYLSSITSVNLAKIVRKDLVQKLISAKYSFLVNIPIGKIITHLNDETDRVSIFYVKLCRSINFLIQALIYSLIAILASWEMSFLLMAFGLITALILQQFNKIFYIIGQEFLNIKRTFNNNISNLFTSIKPLKAMGLENFASNLINLDIKKIKENMSKYWFFESILLAAQEPLSFIFVVFFILTSIKFFNIPIITALFVAAVFYRLSNRLLNFYNSVRNLVNFLPSINSIKEISSVTKKEKEYYEGKKSINDAKQIKLKNITFKYKNNIIFQNLSINFDLKKIIFIDGKSGVGKTTLLDLITGLYKPDKGLIILDNININNINLLKWRQQIGYVSQDPSLFDDTILNNLTLMKNYDEKKMQKILEITFSNNFINKFNKKLNTIVGTRGSKVSGGQRQRLAIARALMQNPKLLILDEATSELNPDLERKILLNIIKYKKTMGIIIVSHNKKNKEFADEYLKVSNKKIIKLSK